MSGTCNIAIAKTAWGTWVRSAIVLVTMSLAPIYVGIITGSSAMQWVGFTWGLVLMALNVAAFANRKRFRTTDEVRAFLDKLDRGEA